MTGTGGAMGVGAVQDAILLVAHAAFLAASLALIRIDVLEHRLPDVIVLPTAAGLAGLLALAAALGGDLTPAGRAAAGGLLLLALYLALRAAAPGGLGGGDVKLAAAVGVFLGWHGWLPLVAGAAGGFVFGAVAAVALLATGRASRDTHIAFGPWMLIGAWAGPLAA